MYALCALTNPSSQQKPSLSPVGLTPKCWVVVYPWGASSPHWVDLCWGEVGERAWTGPAVHWAKGGSLSPTPLGPPRPPSVRGPNRKIYCTTCEEVKE